MHQQQETSPPYEGPSDKPGHNEPDLTNGYEQEEKKKRKRKNKKKKGGKEDEPVPEEEKPHVAEMTPLKDKIGESFFQDEDSSEDEGLPDYKIGGYHPIHVGEILLDRYVII